MGKPCTISFNDNGEEILKVKCTKEQFDKNRELLELNDIDYQEEGHTLPPDMPNGPDIEVYQDSFTKIEKLVKRSRLK